MQQDDDVLKKRFVIKNSALKKVKSEKLELLLHEKHSLLL
jgi:hypothetical protein